jgi:phage tail tape-measure protein
MADKKDKDRLAGDANRDPLTGAPGAHPVGVGVGTAGGAATGAAIGAVAGPVGSAVGAVVGGVAGGLVGKGAAEAVNPTVEDAYWRENYSKRPYVTAGSTYDTYRPAYQYGWESYGRYQGRSFDEVEPELSRNWDSNRTKLSWDRAREATRDAWHRVEKKLPGDADNDGY